MQSSKKEKTIFFLNEVSLRNILDNTKCNNIHIMGIPEGEESKQGIENLFEEIMIKNFHNQVKEKDTQNRKLRESQTSWTQRGLCQNIIIKVTSLKTRRDILKATREKQVFTYKEASIRLAFDHLTETFWTRRA